MIKKVLLFICTLMVTTTCYAYKDTIDGFRGIPWGASIEEVKNSNVFISNTVQYLGRDKEDWYMTKLSNPSLCGIPLSEDAIIAFWDNKLTYISLHCNQSIDKISAYYKLRNEIGDIWGPTYSSADLPDKKKAFWAVNDNESIGLYFDVTDDGPDCQITIGTNRFEDKGFIDTKDF